MTSIDIVVDTSATYDIVVDSNIAELVVGPDVYVDLSLTGPPGVGVPVGGTTGQVLAKATATNYDTHWVDQTGGTGGGAVSSVNGYTGAVVLAASDVGAQPLDSDLTSIAALVTTTFGRGLLTQADAAATRTTLGLGTAATSAATAFDAAGAASAAQSAAATDATTKANNAQAFAIQRANHTGTQLLATISDAGTAAAANTGTTAGTIPVLGTGGVLAMARLATGTPDGTKFVRDDGTLVTPAGGTPSGAAGGDLAGTYPNPTVGKVNGTSLAALATGLLKNTTTTGVPSIAVAADVPTVAAGTTGPLSATDASTTNARTPTGSAGGDLAGTYPNPTLATTAVTAGSYTNTNLTVDAKGRITAAANGGSSGDTYRGFWASGTTYNAGDVVTQGNALWRAGSTTTGYDPLTVGGTVASVTGASPAATGAGNFEQRFTPTSALTVTSIEVYIGTPGDITVGLATPNSDSTNIPWLNSGTAKVTRLAGSLTANAWNTFSLPASVSLASGTQYALDMTGTGASQVYMSTTPVASNVTIGTYSYGSFAGSASGLSALFKLDYVPAANPWTREVTGNPNGGAAGLALLKSTVTDYDYAWGAVRLPALAVNTVAASSTAQTIPDVSAAQASYITLTGNCTFTFPAAGVGKTFRLALKQDATGSRTVTWPGTVKWPAATAPTLTVTAAKTDVLEFTCYDGTNWMGQALALNY